MDIVLAVAAHLVRDRVVRVTFTDGIQADVDFASFPERRGVFRKLDDADYFGTVRLVDGVLT